MTIMEFAMRIGASVLFGFLIGAERQMTGHMAGIRMNILVCLGTNLFVLFSALMDAPDPTRIAAQIVSGVGFLGSGIIFKEGVHVRGLNTAATIWCTAAIGVLTSSGELLYALTATGMLLAANLLFRPIANWIRPLECFDESENYYKVTVTCTEDKELPIRSALMNLVRGTRFLLMNLESADIIGDKVEIEATFLCAGRRRDEIAENLIGKVALEEGVTSIGWEMK